MTQQKWEFGVTRFSLMSNHAIKDERQEPKHHFYLRDLGRFFALNNFLLKHISKSDRGTNPSICVASFESKSKKVLKNLKIRKCQDKNKCNNVIQSENFCSCFLGDIIAPNYHATLVFIYSNLSTLIMIYHHAMAFC